jgi:hypothetical protein
MNVRSHGLLVSRFLDWTLVQQRLARHTNIARCFPEKELRRWSSKPPYYCHYLAWRLGTWKHESWFAFFDCLIAESTRIDGWDPKTRLNSGGFDDFFGSLWELQVAVSFSRLPDVDVRWLSAGPDIHVTRAWQDLFVECYTYRKSFGIELFLEELLQQVSPAIRVYHMPSTRFGLPRGSAGVVDGFLDELFAPFRDIAWLQAKCNEAQKEYPVLLPIPNGTSNLWIYIDGEPRAGSRYVPGRVPNKSGDTGDLLCLAIGEAIKNKANSNSMEISRPNLLMANFLLGGDFEKALEEHLSLPHEPISEIHRDNNIDAMIACTCGIDELPVWKSAWTVYGKTDWIWNLANRNKKIE